MSNKIFWPMITGLIIVCIYICSVCCCMNYHRLVLLYLDISTKNSTDRKMSPLLGICPTNWEKQTSSFGFGSTCEKNNYTPIEIIK